MPLSPRLDSVEMTVERAGMLIPAASVSVAYTTRNRFAWNSSSASFFSNGSIPAWCDAMPRRSRASLSSSTGRSACLRRHSDTRRPSSAASRSLTSGSRIAAVAAAAASQPTREKMKTIAGSIPFRARQRTTNGIVATS
eukprot:3216840-Pleurochrysis_carterae.AAC.1